MSFLRVIEPGVYAHVGYGGELGRPGWLTSDAGATLDLAVSRVRVGVHAGVELRHRSLAKGPVRTAGLHTALRF